MVEVEPGVRPPLRRQQERESERKALCAVDATSVHWARACTMGRKARVACSSAWLSAPLRAKPHSGSLRGTLEFLRKVR